MKQTDLLEKFKEAINWKAIDEIRSSKSSQLESKGFADYRQALKLAPQKPISHFATTNKAIEIGTHSDLTCDEHDALIKALELFIPWKKGPFNFFGHHIDSEWQSDLKWERLKPHFSNLKNKKVADIGCHNGFFMFKMLEQNPELVVGFEPYAKHKIVFDFVQSYVKSDRLTFELLGVENIDLFPKFFDTIFCLGILYHHTDPVGILRKIHQSMKKGGEIIIDCQGIAGDQPMCLVPEGRYARGKGFWFLPTQSALENWLKRAMFKDIEVFFNEPLSINEQRSTKWAPFDSLEQFLDPNDPSKTIEGYPAPRRIYLKAKKP